MSTRMSFFVSLLAWAVYLALGTVDPHLLSAPAAAPYTSSPPAPSPPDTPGESGWGEGGRNRTRDENPVSGIRDSPLTEYRGRGEPISKELRDALVAATPEQILDLAIGRLQEVRWLNVRIHQAKHGGPRPWTSRGTLHRGPDGCARLDLVFETANAGAVQSLIVSDGGSLAEVAIRAGSPPDVLGSKLPTDPAARDLVLDQYGCGGPIAVLKQLRKQVARWTLEVGPDDLTLRGVLAEASDGCRDVRVRMDGTLWPTRVEWRKATGGLLSEVEYRRPVIDEAPTVEQCGKLFTYVDPNPGKRRAAPLAVVGP